MKREVVDALADLYCCAPLMCSPCTCAKTTRTEFEVAGTPSSYIEVR